MRESSWCFLPDCEEFNIAITYTGLESCKHMARQTRLGRGRGTLTATFMGFTSHVSFKHTFLAW